MDSGFGPIKEEQQVYPFSRGPIHVQSQKYWLSSRETFIAGLDTRRLIRWLSPETNSGCCKTTFIEQKVTFTAQDLDIRIPT
jgi:hypothetical protein